MKKARIKVDGLKVAAIVFAVVFTVTGVLLAINLWERHRAGRLAPAFDASSDTIDYNGVKYTKRNNIDTVLFIGLDKYESELDTESFNNDRQADFIMLMVIDYDKEECNVLHINRDTMVDMDVLGVRDGDVIGTVNKQLALSHTYGDGGARSHLNVVNAVENLLMGVNIDYYVAVTMDAVPVYTELLGGVEVEVLDDFSGIDDTLVKGQKVALIGDRALTYVRARKGLDDPTNEGRMDRQRQFVKALYEKTMEMVSADSSFVKNSAGAMNDYVDFGNGLSLERMQTLLDKVRVYDYGGSSTIDGESRMGETFIEYYPDGESVKQTVVDLFYEE